MSDRTAGLLWLAGGAAVTFITYVAAGPGGTYLIAWGAMLFGIVKLLGTLGDARDDDGMPLSYRDRIVLGQEMALRAMYYVACEAGGIEGARAVAIDKALWRITDSQFPAERQAALLAESQAGGDAVLSMLRVERTRMAPSFVPIVLSAAAEVARADGQVGERAEAALQAIARSLGLDAAAVSAALVSASV